MLIKNSGGFGRDSRAVVTTKSIRKKLFDIIDITHGFAFKGEDFSSANDLLMPIVLTPGNFSEAGKLSFTEKNTKRFNSKNYPNGYKFDYGDLVVVMTDLSSQMKILGKPAFIDQDNILHNQRIGRVLFKDENVLPEYIYYFLLTDSSSQIIKSTATGTMVRHTAPKRILSLEILIPPLPEQTRIVAILDEAFANISQAVANAEKNLANARELFDSYLNEVFTRKGEGYKEVTLGKEVSLLTGFPFKSKDFTDKPSDIKLLRGDNVIHAKLRWTDVKRWEASQADSFKDYALLENDIVIAMDRTWISSGIKYAQLTKHDLPCLLVQRVARLRANDNIDSVFLRFIVGSKMFEQYVISVQTGIGVPHISGGQISAFSFWMPKIKEQQKVAQKLAILEENMQQLEDVYRRKLAALAELKQALLQKAFTGELTANHPHPQ